MPNFKESVASAVADEEREAVIGREDLKSSGADRMNFRLGIWPKPAGLSQEDRLALFRCFYQEQNQHVKKTIYWLAGAGAVDDLSQEVFLRAWKSFDRFQGKSSPKTWLHRIAVNVTIDHLRRKQPVPTENLPEESENRSPEMQQLIEKGVSQLSKKQRVCFVLYYKTGLTKEEIAQVEKVPLGTVKSRLHAAKSQFMDFLKENGVSDGER